MLIENNTLAAPFDLLNAINKNFDEYLHFTEKYDEAVSERRFYAAGLIGDYLNKLSRDNKKADKRLNQYVKIVL